MIQLHLPLVKQINVTDQEKQITWHFYLSEIIRQVNNGVRQHGQFHRGYLDTGRFQQWSVYYRCYQYGEYIHSLYGSFIRRQLHVTSKRAFIAGIEYLNITDHGHQYDLLTACFPLRYLITQELTHDDQHGSLL